MPEKTVRGVLPGKGMEGREEVGVAEAAAGSSSSSSSSSSSDIGDTTLEARDTGVATAAAVVSATAATGAAVQDESLAVAAEGQAERRR